MPTPFYLSLFLSLAPLFYLLFHVHFLTHHLSARVSFQHTFLIHFNHLPCLIYSIFFRLYVIVLCLQEHSTWVLHSALDEEHFCNFCKTHHDLSRWHPLLQHGMFTAQQDLIYTIKGLYLGCCIEWWIEYIMENLQRLHVFYFCPNFLHFLFMQTQPTLYCTIHSCVACSILHQSTSEKTPLFCYFSQRTCLSFFCFSLHLLR